MKVQELLNSPDKWTKGSLAEDKNGNEVDYYSPDAVKWCLLGAIIRCYSSEYRKVATKMHDRLKGPITYFNDSHTYKEVMELVRRLDL